MWLRAVREDGGDIVRVELWKVHTLRDEIPGEPIDGDLAAFRAPTCPFDRPDDDRRHVVMGRDHLARFECKRVLGHVAELREVGDDDVVANVVAE
jgi:hypothetical protein